MTPEVKVTLWVALVAKPFTLAYLQPTSRLVTGGLGTGFAQAAGVSWHGKLVQL